MSQPRKADRNDPVICCCNEVRLSRIRAAMDQGARTLAGIYDATWAGCGPCGGSCQPEIAALLQQHLEAEARRRGPGTP